eukprot:3034238-Pyramimonas_sp.AAC.1
MAAHSCSNTRLKSPIEEDRISWSDGTCCNKLRRVWREPGRWQPASASRSASRWSARRPQTRVPAAPRRRCGPSRVRRQPSPSTRCRASEARAAAAPVSAKHETASTKLAGCASYAGRTERLKKCYLPNLEDGRSRATRSSRPAEDPIDRCGQHLQTKKAPSWQPILRERERERANKNKIALHSEIPQAPVAAPS